MIVFYLDGHLPWPLHLGQTMRVAIINYLDFEFTRWLNASAAHSKQSSPQEIHEV